MSSGTVKTITVEPRMLPTILNYIHPNQALALSNIDYSNGREITTIGNQHDDVISRSSGFFPFVSGPAFILFDVDTGDKYNPETIGQVIADITTFIPEFEQAAKVIRPSTGSNIKLKSTGELLSSNTGWHIYCAVKDGSSLSDLKAIRGRLLAKAWNAGLGHIKISKSGSELLRCPIDLAVFSPERLIFEANPILSDELVKGLGKN